MGRVGLNIISYLSTKLTSINSPIEINGVNFYTLPYATVSEMKHYFEDDTIETHQTGITRCIETIAPEIDEMSSMFN